MDTLSQLQAMGLTLPTPAYVIGVVLFGIVGMVACWRARKAGLKRQRWIGIALMFYPYAVSRTWLLYVVGAALCAGLLVDQG